MSENAVIIGAKRVPCAAAVSTWHEHGIEFEAGTGHNKRRIRDIDLVVWHTTGGEGSPATMAATLIRRKLGIEFSIDRAGLIWQFCDPIDVDTADAGAFNARSVGVEIVNYLFRRRGVPVPRAGRSRPTYRATMRNKERTFAHLFPAQIVAGVALAESLSIGLRIPRVLPGLDEYWVTPHELEPAELEAFKGQLGHFHLTSQKSDPGFDFLEALRAAWAASL